MSELIEVKNFGTENLKENGHETEQSMNLEQLHQKAGQIIREINKTLTKVKPFLKNK
jgi:hypothetical protein